ncbi:putative major facilitator superfamily, MFS transporter superfamily [Septoria linicola]|nr:putative major facilitator superfamily, MFS transporter superfamily [Septoria linicola]
MPAEEDDRDSKKSHSTAETRTASERSPLLGHKPRDETASQQHSEERSWGKSIVLRLLFTSTIVSLSFGVTQVPLIYVFGTMTCDEYYKTHPDPGPIGDRCHNTAIQASTARAVALLGAGTTLFGVLNLFYTTWTIKRFGVKSALLSSVFWPAVRLAVQNVGVHLGGGLGIWIIQASQAITIVGGPAGYLLALNSFATEVVQHAARTATLGRLQGCAFFGTALGYLIGGYSADLLGIIWPFRITLGLFLLSSIYILLFLPWIRVELSPEMQKRTQSLSSFFDPLRMFVPSKWRLKDGRVQTEYGIILLGAGAFTALLATGYIPVLLQMYATDVLDFGTTENGWLISINSLIRGCFLTFAFPAIITAGRRWTERRDAREDKVKIEESDIPSLPTDPHEFEPEPIGGGEEPIEPPRPQANQEESFAFDLYYTRYSILVDGILTALATLSSKGWHMYVVSIVLPLAAGTGSAAKGTILQMCSPAQRADALSAISLVEMAARLATTGLFGYVFSAFADIGRPSLTFAVNGGVAVLAFVILVFSRFPPRGSTRIEVDEDE